MARLRSGLRQVKPGISGRELQECAEILYDLHKRMGGPLPHVGALPHGPDS